MKYALTTPRRPKTRISVDLESVSTAERRFLPFVVGVIAELADQSSKLRDRQFVSIDIDNFDHVLADMAPNLRIRVRNTLGKGPSEWDLELKFRRLEDFEPQNVVAQVEPLRKLLESRPVSVVDSSRTASTDRELSAQLDAILHHPDFQRLEASWRGLYYLVNNTETSPELKIKVLNASKQDLHREFAKAVSFDRTFLFKKLHDDVYGVRSAEPFGVLIGAYEFASEKEDIEILEGMGRIAAATHAPFIAAAAPRLFGADVFAALKSQPGITSPAFNRFRKSDEARFVALTLPRALMRVAYGNAHPVETFNYQEDAAAAENRLWGNMAFVYGVILTSAYSRHGWLGNITGTEGGGLCQTLPLALSPADDSDEPVSCSTDLAIHEEKRWSDLGFLAARHWPGAEYSSFQSNRSIADPNVPLRFTFAACRFAQQIKVIARDKPGGYGSREECERALNLWIRLYVLKLDPDRAESYPRAAKPLLDGSVSVTQDQSGLCRAEVRIQPLYQIAEAPVVSAVAALPSGIIAGAV